MKWMEWNDGLLPGGRRPKLWLVTSQAIYRFTGENIPCVCVVGATTYEKAGKWSNTTYRLHIADGVKAVCLVAPLHGGVWESCDGWQSAVAKFSQMLGGARFSRDAFVARMRLDFETACKRFDAFEAALAEMNSASAAPVETDVLEFSFGSPTNRQIREGYWSCPIVIMSDSGEVIATITPNKDWTSATSDDPRVAVASLTKSPGHHGGYRELRVLAPAGAKGEFR